MAYEITCTNCNFTCRVQTETVAELTATKHESDFSNTCSDECEIEDVGVETLPTESYT